MHESGLLAVLISGPGHFNKGAGVATRRGKFIGGAILGQDKGDGISDELHESQVVRFLATGITMFDIPIQTGRMEVETKYERHPVAKRS